ncbi:MAG: sulfatase family protein [Limisphaerales bacterium]
MILSRKLSCLFVVFSCVFAVSVQGKLPNLVVFISDDLGRLDTSVYGSKDARTPTMEQLAARGMTFNNAYVASPSCCPNRFSLLTGLMPARHGAHPNHSKVNPGTKFLLPILQKLGYHVASFGKVAHGRNKNPGTDFNSPPPREMSQNVLQHFGSKKIDQPICLLVGDRRPHVSWSKDSTYDPKKVTLPPYFIDTPETRTHWARYLTDITGMDKEMGRVWNFAQKRFGDDFIFLFTSDHGGQWHMGKWTLYDTGTRIPLQVVWPGRIKPGTRTDAFVSWVDLIPTLIDLAGGEVPEDLDGRSFKNVLLGETMSHRQKIFTTHTGDGVMNIFPIRSVRIGRYKYIHNLRPDAWFTNHSDRHRKDGAGAFWDSWDAAAKKSKSAAEVLNRYYTRPEYEFFDLEKDPLELNNLAADPASAKRIAPLRAALAAWTESQGDDLQTHREPYLRSQPIPHFDPSKPKKRRKKK